MRRTPRGSWYERQGAARQVLEVGEIPIPEPGRGEVRIRVEASGIHSGDLGKRRGWWGSTMAFPRVIPHGDGAGVIDAVGPDVGRGRLGERVWTYLVQSYRPFGTAAEYVVVPAERAVPPTHRGAHRASRGVGHPGHYGPPSRLCRRPGQWFNRCRDWRAGSGRTRSGRRCATWRSNSDRHGPLTRSDRCGREHRRAPRD
jgi:Alcohol dehydrogenase GroES-like domain